MKGSFPGVQVLPMITGFLVQNLVVTTELGNQAITYHYWLLMRHYGLYSERNKGLDRGLTKSIAGVNPQGRHFLCIALGQKKSRFQINSLHCWSYFIFHLSSY
jgi:hypothetical protein